MRPLLDAPSRTCCDESNDQHRETPDDDDRERCSEVDVERGHEDDSDRLEGSTPPLVQQRTDARFARAFASFVVVVAVALPARAAEPISYAVNARIYVDDAVVTGAMHTEVWVGEGEREVRLWLYGDRLAVAPSAMDQMSGRWVFPGEVSLGGIDVSDVRLEDGGEIATLTPRVERHAVGTLRGRDFAGADLVVPVTPGPRRPVQIRLRFVERLPDRFGRLGVANDVISLVAPWYPLVVDGDASRFDVPHRVHIETEGNGELLVGDRRVEPGATVTQRGAFVPVVLAPRFYERRLSVSGLDLRVLGTRPFYSPPPAEARGAAALADIVRIDVPALMGEALGDVLATLRQADVPHRAGPVTVAVLPLRVELAGTVPGLVIASDRIYEIFPIDDTREFHQRAFRRVLFRHLVEPLSTRLDPPADRGWADDLRAVLLTDVDDARRHGHARTPGDLIGFAAFHPAVDQLLYAPQVEFVEIFFGVIDEPDLFRDDPDRARRAMSRGRRVLESARDVLDEEAFDRFSVALLAGRVSARDAVAAGDPPAAGRVDGWLDAVNREVNYRLGEITSEPSPGGGYVHHVTVERDGPERIEPVEVQVEDEDGNVEVGVWDGRGERGVVDVTTPAEIDEVRINPRERLPQSPALADGHPRGDDATSQPWRLPLIRGFGLNLALSEGEVYGFIDFALRRRYDLEEGFTLQLAHLSSTTGGTIGYFRGLGPKRHNNSRIGYASFGLDFNRVREAFVGTETGGWRLSLAGSVGFDTRSYFYDPREGSSLGLSLRLGGIVRDDETLGVTASVRLRGSHTFGFGLRNALLVVGELGWTFGDALPGELQQLGGRFLMRGFDASEVVGRGKGFIVAEHRYTPWSDLSINVLHLAWLRRSSSLCGPERASSCPRSRPTRPSSAPRSVAVCGSTTRTPACSPGSCQSTSDSRSRAIRTGRGATASSGAPACRSVCGSASISISERARVRGTHQKWLADRTSWSTRTSSTSRWSAGSDGPRSRRTLAISLASSRSWNESTWSSGTSTSVRSPRSSSASRAPA